VVLRGPNAVEGACIEGTNYRERGKQWSGGRAEEELKGKGFVKNIGDCKIQEKKGVPSPPMKPPKKSPHSVMEEVWEKGFLERRREE